MDKEELAKLELLEDIIEVKFKNKKLLVESLSHRSYSAESEDKKSNERLEFLGDSVLSAVVSTYLYDAYPLEDEGTLSRLKSVLISRKTLYRWAKEINLGKYLYLSYSENITGGRARESILSNALESLFGAIYLEKGYDELRKIVFKRLESKKRIIERDYKSRLQEIVQQKYKLIPEYEVVSQQGPDHDKTFEIEVKIKKQVLGSGMGKSKKEAEQEAAKKALKRIK